MIEAVLFRCVAAWCPGATGVTAAEKFAKARPLLARQLGGALAGIHGLAASKLPKLRRMTATSEIADLELEYRGFEWPRPVFELALCWLKRHDPGPPKEMMLVHGDF